MKSLPPTNQHTAFYRPDAFSIANQQCQNTVGKNITFHGLALSSPGGLSTLSLTTNSYWLP